MLRIRFPNGQCIRYNTATYASCTQYGYSDLYTKKDGTWIAQVPNTCIIESVAACNVSNPIAKQDDLETARELKAIKRKLQKVLNVQR